LEQNISVNSGTTFGQRPLERMKPVQPHLRPLRFQSELSYTPPYSVSRTRSDLQHLNCK